MMVVRDKYSQLRLVARLQFRSPLFRSPLLLSLLNMLVYPSKKHISGEYDNLPQYLNALN